MGQTVLTVLTQKSLAVISVLRNTGQMLSNLRCVPLNPKKQLARREGDQRQFVDRRSVLLFRRRRMVKCTRSTPASDLRRLRHGRAHGADSSPPPELALFRALPVLITRCPSTVSGFTPPWAARPNSPRRRRAFGSRRDRPPPCCSAPHRCRC
jgi:hypothetical protein